jgi:uncharacterized RDD family membrane protein YckC
MESGTGPQPPEGPQSPAPGPQSPAPGAPPPPPSPESPAPQYGGPVPPGGWQQPVAQPAPPLPGPLASWGSRLGAYVIDGLIVAVPALVILGLFGVGFLANGDSDNGGFIALIGGLILSVLVIVVISFLYAPLLMARDGARNGQTWGKQMLGIRAVRDNGRPWDFGSAALREVVLKNLAVGIASSIIPLIPWFLNFFWPLWDDQNRALHDMAVSSHVVDVTP